MEIHRKEDREIQREMRFSSPSSAFYQLDKLGKLELVKKDNIGDYTIGKVVETGYLKNFFFLGGHALPKSAVYGSLVLSVDLICLAPLIGLNVEFVIYSATLPGLISSATFWNETLNATKYRRKPRNVR